MTTFERYYHDLQTCLCSGSIQKNMRTISFSHGRFIELFVPGFPVES